MTRLFVCLGFSPRYASEKVCDLKPMLAIGTFLTLLRALQACSDLGSDSLSLQIYGKVLLHRHSRSATIIHTSLFPWLVLVSRSCSIHDDRTPRYLLHSLSNLSVLCLKFKELAQNGQQYLSVQCKPYPQSTASDTEAN